MTTKLRRVRFAQSSLRLGLDSTDPEGLTGTAQPKETMLTTMGQSPDVQAPGGGFAPRATPPTPFIGPAPLPAVLGGPQEGCGAPVHYNSTSQSITVGLTQLPPAHESGALGLVFESAAPGGLPDLDPLLQSFHLDFDVKTCSFRLPALLAPAFSGPVAVEKCTLYFSEGTPCKIEPVTISPLCVIDVLEEIGIALRRELSPAVLQEHPAVYKEAVRAKDARGDNCFRTFDAWPGTALYFHGLRPVPDRGGFEVILKDHSPRPHQVRTSWSAL
ncbi:hypothetical protein BN946_scf184844.g36 [Trametes cinnabarina]|uniref:Uncharacterized protein n=1 Tax=Pycnoporus cinnabarinus TaxID=5643 RepID=A0A060S944_PYCCI|nr:hypothetical protein BN946_scf184844.g36 [Trametes cinnabarina]